MARGFAETSLLTSAIIPAAANTLSSADGPTPGLAPASPLSRQSGVRPILHYINDEYCWILIIAPDTIRLHIGILGLNPG
jgi:hypothetical protein